MGNRHKRGATSSDDAAGELVGIIGDAGVRALVAARKQGMDQGVLL